MITDGSNKCWILTSSFWTLTLNSAMTCWTLIVAPFLYASIMLSASVAIHLHSVHLLITMSISSIFIMLKMPKFPSLFPFFYFSTSANLLSFFISRCKASFYPQLDCWFVLLVMICNYQSIFKIEYCCTTEKLLIKVCNVWL